MSELSKKLRELHAIQDDGEGGPVDMKVSRNFRDFYVACERSVPALCAEVETLELKLRAIREWCARVDFEQKSDPRAIYEARREGAQAVAYFIDAGGMDRYVEALRRNEAASAQGADAPPDPFPPVPAEYQVPPYKTNQESELR